MPQRKDQLTYISTLFSYRGTGNSFLATAIGRSYWVQSDLNGVVHPANRYLELGQLQQPRQQRIQSIR